MKIILTGAGGFIGMHVARQLLKNGHSVAGIDNLNDYYDVDLKRARLKIISKEKRFTFHYLNILDKENLDSLFRKFEPEIVIHLAAQAGVRFSIENPYSYIDSNVSGFMNVLEACRLVGVSHLVYASSSSVYGLNSNLPFNEGQNVDHPLAIYGATKKANELMAHSYSSLFGIPTTGLRFFTVYGPWGRPDMALFKFTRAMLKNKEIKIYNQGNMIRDFTFIDDVVEGVQRVAEKPASADNQFDESAPDPGISSVPWRIFNIGNGQPTPLMQYIEALEKALEIKAKKTFLDMQPGDVQATSADCERLWDWVGFKPKTDVHEGVKKFVDWYRGYYQV